MLDRSLGHRHRVVHSVHEVRHILYEEYLAEPLQDSSDGEGEIVLVSRFDGRTLSRIPHQRSMRLDDLKSVGFGRTDCMQMSECCD